MKLKLLDTGYLSATTTLGSQTQYSAANRAGYTGATVSAFTLDVERITRARPVNTENKTAVDTFTDSNTSLVSVGNRTYTIDTIWTKQENTSGWSTSEIYQFLRLELTKGLKLLYPSEVSPSLPTIVEIEGAVNKGGTFSSGSPSEGNGTVASTVAYMVGRVKNISVNDSPSGNKWRIGLTFEVSG